MAHVLGVILLIALVVVIGVTLALGALAILPDDQSVRPQVDYHVDRDDGQVVLDARYMTGETPQELLVNGEQIHAWKSEDTTSNKQLECLFSGDDVAVRADAGRDRSYLLERFNVDGNTTCPYNGSRRNLDASIVDGIQPDVFDSTYEFTLSIDPDGPGSQAGVMPADNPWHHIQRYDREIENLEPPVYVVVFADNANWGSDPPGEPAAGAYTIDESGDLTATPTNSEKTNDVYMVFQPGCSSSTVKFIAETASFSNQILLGDSVIIPNTNNATPGNTTSAPGVSCISR